MEVKLLFHAAIKIKSGGLPDWPCPNFRASKSVDRGALSNLEFSFNRFWGSKIVEVWARSIICMLIYVFYKKKLKKVERMISELWNCEKCSVGHQKTKEANKTLLAFVNNWRRSNFQGQINESNAAAGTRKRQRYFTKREQERKRGQWSFTNICICKGSSFFFQKTDFAMLFAWLRAA